MVKSLALFAIVIAVFACGCSKSGPSADDDKRVREGMSREYTPEELAKMGATPGGAPKADPPAVTSKKRYDIPDQQGQK